MVNPSLHVRVGERIGLSQGSWEKLREAVKAEEEASQFSGAVRNGKIQKAARLVSEVLKEVSQ